MCVNKHDNCLTMNGNWLHASLNWAFSAIDVQQLLLWLVGSQIEMTSMSGMSVQRSLDTLFHAPVMVIKFALIFIVLFFSAACQKRREEVL